VQLTAPRATLAAACAAFALAGCATTRPSDDDVPLLRLAPSTLGHPLALQQHLTLRAPGRTQEMDVLLEADVAHVQLALVAMGQVAARIDWDGHDLTESRVPWWPASVSSARILNEMQLSLWPLAAVQAALPAGWRASDDGATRTLAEAGTPVLLVHRVGDDTLELEQRREHYALTIVSRPAQGGAAP
jgi:hypothetical protein